MAAAVHLAYRKYALRQIRDSSAPRPRAWRSVAGSGWLLAGFGAVFGLLIANFATLSDHIAASSLKLGAGLFFVAAAFAALQKLLAAYVAAGTAAGEDGRGIGKELASGKVPLDVDSMYKQVRDGLFWPLSSFNARMTEKAKSGGFAVVGRHHQRQASSSLFWSCFNPGLVLHQPPVSSAALQSNNSFKPNSHRGDAWLHAFGYIYIQSPPCCGSA